VPGGHQLFLFWYGTVNLFAPSGVGRQEVARWKVSSTSPLSLLLRSGLLIALPMYTTRAAACIGGQYLHMLDRHSGLRRNWTETDVADFPAQKAVIYAFVPCTYISAIIKTCYLPSISISLNPSVAKVFDHVQAPAIGLIQSTFTFDVRPRGRNV
jgi:hypothetical protein